jgi:hypothetical protein
MKNTEQLYEIKGKMLKCLDLLSKDDGVIKSVEVRGINIPMSSKVLWWRSFIESLGNSGCCAIRAQYEGSFSFEFSASTKSELADHIRMALGIINRTLNEHDGSR